MNEGLGGIDCRDLSAFQVNDWRPNVEIAARVLLDLLRLGHLGVVISSTGPTARRKRRLGCRDVFRRLRLRGPRPHWQGC